MGILLTVTVHPLQPPILPHRAGAQPARKGGSLGDSRAVPGAADSHGPGADRNRPVFPGSGGQPLEPSLSPHSRVWMSVLPSS